MYIACMEIFPATATCKGDVYTDFFRAGKRRWRFEGLASRQDEKQLPFIYMGVSENSGIPKWMVYNVKPYQDG